MVTDDHAGRRRALAEVLPEAAGQRCYAHILRNALDHLPRKAADDCLTGLRWLSDRRAAAEARLHLRARLERWAAQISEALRLGRGRQRAARGVA